MEQEHRLKRVNFCITTLQIQKLKAYSSQTGLSLSEIVRRAIDEYLERRSNVSNDSEIYRT